MSRITERLQHSVANKILTESCQGLTTQQRLVVEGIYTELRPLIEVSLSQAQIGQLFGNVEQAATASGQNRTLVGQTKDEVKQQYQKVNDIINKAGKWIQDTRPVQAFDQKFEQLKTTVSQKFPALEKNLTQLGTWAKQNPAKTAAIIGIMTSIAALAAGPAGGAIAGQILRGTSGLLQGEKASTAIGKGLKTAAVGWLAGKSIENISNIVGRLEDYLNPKPIDSDALFYVSNIGNGLPSTFQKTDIYGTREQMSQFNKIWMQAINAWDNKDYGAAEKYFQDAKEFASETTLQTLKQVGKRDPYTLIDSLNKMFDGLIVAAQGAAAGATAFDKQGKPVTATTEHAAPMFFENKRNLDAQEIDVLFENILSKLGGVASRAAQKVSTVGKNITTRITVDKLNKLWAKAGKPTDSDEIAKMLIAANIPRDAVITIYKSMNIPTPDDPVATPARPAPARPAPARPAPARPAPAAQAGRFSHNPLAETTVLMDIMMEQTLAEKELSEQDLIVLKGHGKKLKPGLMPKHADRTDHEVEMALSDLHQAAKNAKMIFDLIKDVSEEEGLEGWVQKKIIKASDYLNTVREYMEHKSMQKEGSAGAKIGAVAGAALTRSLPGAIKGAQIGSSIQDMFERDDALPGGVLAGGMSNFEEGVAEGDNLQGTPVVSLNDFTGRDFKKGKYGRTVPKKLKKNDPRVKFYKEPQKQGVAKADKNQEIDEMTRRGFLGQLGLGAAALAGLGGTGRAEARATPEWLKKVEDAKKLLAQGMTKEQVAKKLGVAGPNNGMSGTLGGDWGAINRAAEQLAKEKEPRRDWLDMKEDLDQSVEEGRLATAALAGLMALSPGVAQAQSAPNVPMTPQQRAMRQDTEPALQLQKRAEELAQQMGISSNRMTINAIGGVVTEINGVKVPAKLYTEKEIQALRIGQAMQKQMRNMFEERFGPNLEKLVGLNQRELDRMYEKINLISQKYKDDPEIQRAIQTLKKDIENFIAKRMNQNPIDIATEGKKDACYRKVKSRYKVWPSAYASGALVKCRKVGAKNWGKSKKK